MTREPKIDLWQRLQVHFELDDGSLPDLLIAGLTGDEVCRIYNWVRSRCGVFCETIEPTFWHRQLKRDVPIVAVDDPAQMVVLGQAESFRHGLTGLSIDGVEMPQLSVAVFPNSIEFDYRLGKEWGAPQLDALFEFLLDIQRLAPNADISHAHEGSDNRTADFDVVWKAFRRLRNC